MATMCRKCCASVAISSPRRLRPVEAMVGVTRHAARALGEQDHLGQLRVGMAADFLIWHCAHPAELSYMVGVDQLVGRIFNGEETLHG